MANQSGIAITIKAFLPTGKTLDEQFAALSIVKDAHESGDYTALLKAAGVDEVKTEQKTRRIEDVVPAPTGEPQLTGSGANERSHEEGDAPLASSGTEGQSISTNSPQNADESGIKAEFDKVEPAGEIDPVVDEADEPVPEFIKKGRSKAA